jgi:NADH:ubiquinone oxidoreductase subunit F (NADH-binding)
MTTTDRTVPVPERPSGAPPGWLKWGTLPRLLPTPAARGLADHLDRYGPAPTRPAGLVDAVKAAGLRGRGGAGYPTGLKLAAVAGRRRTIVVANGLEGEPASDKDKTLLSLAPHLVLDGVVLAAQAVGAREAIVCVARSSVNAIEDLRFAVAERERIGLDSVAVTLALSPDPYVAGEESALIHWLNGGEAKPTVVPPRPFERGVAGRPTLVDNVETLAQLALIGRFGPAWWRSVGTADDPGSALFTVSGSVTWPGVYEVPLGMRLGTVLAAAGATAAGTEAVLVGGCFGTWIRADMVGHVRLGVESLRQVGASFGCGVLAVLPPQSCGLTEAARITRWLAGENAGQCGPCMFGLPAIADAMDVLVRGDATGGAERQLTRWLGMVKGRGACKHPDGAARFVESSVQIFADEIIRHRHRGPCSAAAPPLMPLPAHGGWR